MWITFINFLIVYGALALFFTIIEFIIKPLIKKIKS